MRRLLAVVAVLVVGCSSPSGEITPAPDEASHGGDDSAATRADDAGTTTSADGGAASDGGTVANAKGSGGSGGALGDSAGPCPSCRVHVPASYTPGKPAPLLVALHGDEGRDFGLDAATAGVVDRWKAAADAAGAIVFAPACPAAKGCDGAWSDWLAAESYQPSDASMKWLDDQVSAIEAKYDVDTSREHLTGWSGGAYWLGYYAPARASRFAGVAFVAGGMPAYQAFHACPTCKMPAYFLAGNQDPRTKQESDTANAFAGCGSEVVRDLFAGDHEQTIDSLVTGGRAGTILTWLLARPKACP